jgi:hypothetical protein
MAVPNYTYLKMKMPGPNDVITVGSSIEHAFDCDVECVEHAEALALDEALVTTLEKMVNVRLLGIGLDQLRPSTTPFHGVAPGKRVQPLGQIDLPVWFGTTSNFRKEMLTFEVVGFRGRLATPSSWPSRTTPTSR